MTAESLESLVRKWRENEVIGDRSRETFRQCADELSAALAEMKREPGGSSVCPICGKDTPHYHPPEVQEARNKAVRAITDQHLLCIRLSDALRGMPFPPHMPDEAGNAMRGALKEFDDKSAQYLSDALGPSSPTPSHTEAEALTNLAAKFREMAATFDTDQKRIDYIECASMLEHEAERKHITHQAGWVLVPREPTKEMKEAGGREFMEARYRTSTVEQQDADRIYKAMLSAVPIAAAQPKEDKT